ncbi:MAG TPA: chorismate mutase [Caulobacteraceae bacterium]
MTTTAITALTVDDHLAPEACETMVHVREGVDALDRALVQLLQERQRFMDAAARIKPGRDVVHDDARIQDVLDKVTAAADAAGLSRDIALPVWKVLIDRCIAHEFAVWDRTRT